MSGTRFANDNIFWGLCFWFFTGMNEWKKTQLKDSDLTYLNKNKQEVCNLIIWPIKIQLKLLSLIYIPYWENESYLDVNKIFDDSKYLILDKKAIFDTVSWSINSAKNRDYSEQRKYLRKKTSPSEANLQESQELQTFHVAKRILFHVKNYHLRDSWQRINHSTVLLDCLLILWALRNQSTNLLPKKRLTINSFSREGI